MAEAVIKRYGGHVAQYLGDGLLVYFGYPEGLEDASRAGVRAGLGILEAVGHANEQWAAAGKTTIEVRIGIHTGVVVVDDHLALGDTTNIAARLEGLAPHDGVVISLQTLRLVEGWFEVKSIGKHTLKGISQPMEVFQVLRESGARTRLEVAKTAGLSPLVGREKEFKLLREKWEEIKNGKGQVVLLNGEAGIGKSRLTDTIKEYVANESDSWLTEVRCSSYHQNSSFFPIIELLENVVLGFTPEDSLEHKLEKLEGFLLQSGMNMDLDPALFAEFLSISSKKYPPLNLSPMAKKMRIMDGLTKGLLHRAGIQPVLLLVEDLHWADPSTLEWLNSFLTPAQGTPILMLCTTRPNYDPQWEDLPGVTKLDLHRLNAEQITRICQFHTKGKSLPVEVLEQIVEKTGGVPLFVEELIKMVLESRIMVEAEDGYELKGKLPPLAIPSTLQDSLLARLDQISRVKEVVQLGAVIGREFSLHLLSIVLGVDQSQVLGSIRQLMESEIIYKIQWGNKELYQFKHALIQDAAYSAMLTSQRQQLHGQVARAYEDHFPDVVSAQPEVVAHHYTQADLPIEAIPYWKKAGNNALGRNANSEAVHNFKQALSLVDRISPIAFKEKTELGLLNSLGPAIMMAKNYSDKEARNIFSRAWELCQKVNLPIEQMKTLMGLFANNFIGGDHLKAYAIAEKSLQMADRHAGNTLFQVMSNNAIGISYLFRGQLQDARFHLEKAISLYDPEEHDKYAALSWGHFYVNAGAYYTWNLMFQGCFVKAQDWINSLFLFLENRDNHISTFHAYFWTSIFHLTLKQMHFVEKFSLEYLPIAKKYGDPFYISQASLVVNLYRAYEGDRDELNMASQIVDTLEKMGVKGIIGNLRALVIDCHLHHGNYDLAEQLSRKTLALIEKTGELMHQAEHFRMLGKSLIGLGASVTVTVAEAEFQKAISIAKEKGAKLFQLRAARDLAVLRADQGRTGEGAALLREVYDSFTEGWDSPDLVAAREQLSTYENSQSESHI